MQSKSNTLVRTLRCVAPKRPAILRTKFSFIDDNRIDMLIPFKTLGILNHDALATPRLIRTVYDASVPNFGTNPKAPTAILLEPLISQCRPAATTRRTGVGSQKVHTRTDRGKAIRSGGRIWRSLLFKRTPIERRPTNWISQG